MTSLINRSGERERFLSFLAGRQSTEGIAADAGTAVPPTIETWLRRLRQLNGLPFNYLVPNERMLPNESIRFFNVDAKWLQALVEGACSIGQSSRLDDQLHAMTAPLLRMAAGGATDPQGDDSDAASGFLLRSQVVSGWPRLEVVAHDAEGNELTDVWRMERLSEYVLLFLVQGRIDQVVLREPAIGLHFGIDLQQGKPLRYVTVPRTAPAGTRPGDQMAGVSVAPHYRDPAYRTLRISRLAKDLSEALHAHEGDNAPDGTPLTFSSAEFALQLVEGTQQVTFRNEQEQEV